MDKILEIEMPNGIKINALAILICYSQNRIFTVHDTNNGNLYYDKILVEYCVIPNYDFVLEMNSEINK